MFKMNKIKTCVQCEITKTMLKLYKLKNYQEFILVL